MTVAITQAELIEALATRGFRVTARRLTDWRAKGLLPPLNSQGRGRGRGKRYVLRDPETVIEQAVVVRALLARHARTQSAIAALWFGGFSVDVKKAKNAWLENIDRGVSRTRLRAKAVGALDTALGNWAYSLAGPIAQRHALDKAPLTDLLFEALNLLFVPDYDFDPTSSAEPVELVFRQLIGEAGQIHIPELANEDTQAKAAKFLKSVFSADAISRIIGRATEKELSRAWRAWKSIGNIISRMPPIASKEARPIDGLSNGRQLAIAFGPAGVFLLLCSIKFDPVRTVDRTIELFEELVVRPEFELLPTQLRNADRTPSGNSDIFPDFPDRLKSIWSEFNWQDFRAKIQEFHADFS